MKGLVEHMVKKNTDTLYLHATYPHPMVEHLNQILPSLDKSDLERFETKLVRRYKVVFPNEEQEIANLEALGTHHLIQGFYECLDKGEKEKTAFLTKAVQTLVPEMDEWNILEALESFMYIHKWEIEIYVPRKKKEKKKPEKKKVKPEAKKVEEKPEEKEEKKIVKKEKPARNLVEALEKNKKIKKPEEPKEKEKPEPEPEKRVVKKEKTSKILFEEQMSLYERKKLKQAMDGKADAQYEIGNFYAEEGTNHVDYVEAEKWYQKSMVQGNDRAKFALAQLYDSGEGTTENPRKEALRYYLELADHGYPTAQCIIGLKYRFGVDVKADDKEAEKWLLRAAVQGNVDAQRHLADLYLFYNKRTDAVRWLKNASGRGDSYSARRLQRLL